jgi:hypothetical protein
LIRYSIKTVHHKPDFSGESLQLSLQAGYEKVSYKVLLPTDKACRLDSDGMN